ncbi:MAG: phosphoglycerate dehydrogenase [Gemmataceae bacterium]
MPRILICDKLEFAGLDLLAHAGFEVDNRPGLKGEELREAIRQADGCIVRSGTKITADLLEDPDRLRAIVRAGVGVDNIDVAAATRQGIVVMNTPGGNTVSAAEHTIALLLAMARHIPAADAAMKAGKWERNKFMGAEVAGKTLGVIGLGRIGREVCRRAAGLDMNVLGFDAFIKPERAAELGINVVVSVQELLPQCDFLTVHTPLNDETRNLIDRPQIAKLKPGCRLINVARGGIFNEEAIAEALTSGAIAGAALDVFAQEPPPANSPLFKAPNLLMTPHLGASTLEAQEAVAVEAAQLLIDCLSRGVVQSAVNATAIDRAELDVLKHYIDLARRLGMLQAQMAEGPIKKATLIYRGEIASRQTRLLTAAFAAGVMSYKEETVNAVNAELLARERGVEFIEAKSPRGSDFASMIETDVVSEKGTITASGTLFGNQWLRLVQLESYRLEAYLDGVLLLFHHKDQPGLIGHIGTVFGKHGVNIAQMNVGRREAGGEAIAVLNLDTVPSDAALAEVRRHPHVNSLKIVQLPPAGQMPGLLG